MKPLTRSLLAAALSAALSASVLLALQSRQQRHLKALRDANDRLLFRIAMNHGQRSDPTAPASPPDTPAAPAAAAPSDIQTTNTTVAHPDYRDEGQATPLATLQTFAWACDRGDTGTLASLIVFDEAGRTKTVAFIASLPEETRSQWKSAEDMAASLLAAASIERPFPAANILARGTVVFTNEKRAVIKLPGTLKDGTEYQRCGESWKYVITEAAVDAYLSRHSAPPPK